MVSEEIVLVVYVRWRAE